jgi:hypothetical protein
MPQGQRTLTEVDGVVEIGPDTLGFVVEIGPDTLYGRELSGMADGKGRRRNRGGLTTSRQGQGAGGRSSDVDGARAARGREGDGASISCSRSSRRPLGLGGQPGT